MKPIGVVHTPFKEKFGIPRQSGLVPAAVGELAFFPPYDDPVAFEGLEFCTHLWLQFLFHQSSEQWAPRVRPPRLGGNRKLGVFATRSPNRPNRLGLSVVRLLQVKKGPVRLKVGGIDLLDGTPLLDVKPYVPYADAPDFARYPGFEQAPERLPVHFSEAAGRDCQVHGARLGLDLSALLTQFLSLDPRPAYHQDERSYGNRIYDLDVHWRVDDGEVVVISLEETQSGPE